MLFSASEHGSVILNEIEELEMDVVEDMVSDSDSKMR